jgi:hypothetical protein
MKNIDLDWVPTKKPRIVSRILDGEAPQQTEAILILPEKGEVKVVNYIGARIWSLIDGKRTVKDIISDIYKEYQVEKSRALEDICEYLFDLEKRDIITFITTNNNEISPI